METVYKYPLEVADWQEVALPFGAQILFIEVQNGSLYLWAKVNTEEPKELVTIRMAGTGHDLKSRGGAGNFEYINSIFMHNRSLVFHFFRVTNPLSLSPIYVLDSEAHNDNVIIPEKELREIYKNSSNS